MKKFITLALLLMAIVITATSQQRFMIIEHFTGASCSPCANQNPGLEELLSHNTDKVVLLAHQINIPGYDPMYYEYPEGTDARASYYGVNSVPQSVLDGNAVGPGSVGDITQEALDTRSQVPSPFNFDLSFETTNEQIEVNLEINAVSEVSGNLVVRIAVIENEIAFDDNPGSNREKDFIKVLKQFLPDPDGIDIEDSWSPGDNQNITESWVFENVYDINEIAVIAYIQDIDTREIHQAAFAKPKILHTLDAKLSKLHELPEEMCPGNPEGFAPRIVVTNYGSTPITSFDVECAINNGPTQTYSWAGTLNHIDPAIIHFEEMTLGTLLTENDVTAQVTNINNLTTDDNPDNNVDMEGFIASMSLSTSFQIRFRTGGLGDGFMWRVVCDGDTPVPAEYVDYHFGYNSADTIVIDINLTEDCWRFVMKKGTGTLDNFFFEIIDQGEIQHHIEDMGYYLHIPFFVDPYLNYNTQKEQNDLKVYPNPSQGIINLTNTEIADVYIYDLHGRILKSLKKLPPHTSINLNDLKNGLYLIRIEQNSKVTTEVISVMK